MPDHGESADARQFAATFVEFMQWASETASTRRDQEVVALLKATLGDQGAGYSVITRDFAPFEHVNLQTALNAWSSQAGRSVETHGLTMPPHYGPISLQQLMGGDHLPPLRMSAPALVDLPNGPDSTLACLQLALLIVTDERGSYALMIQSPSEVSDTLSIEIAGLPVDQAQRVASELDHLRSRLNVYRGAWLDVTSDDMGGIKLSFVTDPAPTRDEVILPQPLLDRLERHTVGVAQHREALAAAGQHLKRGLLLFGPPGTGKTHSTRYVMGQMNGYTRLTLTGRSLHAVGAVTALARELQPSVVVLEDVDLVAEDRSFGPGSSPVLFDLLDAMDGAAGDADLVFLLTTNRADLLEPALAARPGRVDVAIEIALPDESARRQLLDLYGSRVPLQLSTADADDTVLATEGVTASFLKELVRRAVLESLKSETADAAGPRLGSRPRPEVSGEHLRAALDELLEDAQSVTRTLLGAGDADSDDDDVSGLAVSGGSEHRVPRSYPQPGIAPRRGSFGWFSYGPRH